MHETRANFKWQTVYATHGASIGENSPTEGAGGAGSPTTTIEQTSTFTRVITVQPVETSGTGNSPVGGSGANGSCAPQVTVTVTGPAQTVTVVR